MRLVTAGLAAAELHDKRSVQVLDIGLVNLVQRREPLSVIGLVIGEPIPRFALSVFQPIECYIRSSQRRRQQCSNDPARGETQQSTCSALQRLRCC